MADRTKLDSNFISLVLSVSGRVRPIDLHAIPESERGNALQAFYQQHSASMPLRFDGEDLVMGAGSAPAAPAPAPAPAAAAPAPVADATTELPAAAQPEVAPAEPFVSDYAAASGPAPTADAPSPAADTSPISDSDFFAIPPASATPASPADAPAPAGPDAPVGEMQFPAEKVSFVFWLLPVFLTWVGGIIAFFLVRKTNPKTAKAMLITGIVLTVVFAIAGVAAVLGLGLLAAPGLS